MGGIYREQGDVISTGGAPGEWMFIVPESNDDLLCQKVCRQPRGKDGKEGHEEDLK